ncbi:MAG: alpha/beta hydrolase [Myxococcales bacterium]|nr:alpha/beta hydrolase [Myxococcales bacterium]
MRAFLRLLPKKSFWWPLFALFFVSSLQFACDGLPASEKTVETAPSEKLTQEISTDRESSAPERESIVVEGETTVSEPSQPDATTEPSAEPPPERGPPEQKEATPESVQEVALERTEQQTESLPELSPEPQPEISPEPQPEAPPAISAKAVSLISPIFENSPQSGLLDYDATTKLWTRILWLPAGSLRFAFQIDQNTQHLGDINASTWPLQGFLLPATAPVQVTVAQAGRYRVSVDLQGASFKIEALPAITSARIVGTWDGQSNQQVVLTLDPQTGMYQADIAFKAGDAAFSIELQQQGQWKRHSPPHAAYDAFPQGGVLEEGTTPSISKIPQDDTYRVTVDPRDLRFTLHYKPDDPVLRYQALLQDLSSLTDPAQKNARILPFFRRLSALRQIPIIKGREIIFLLWWSMQAPVSVAGTFNQWQAGQHTMNRVAGTDFYHLKLTMTQDTQYAYKFVDSASTPQWITDPTNRRFEYGPFGPNSLFQTDATTDASTLEEHADFSAKKLQNKRKLIIYLPPGYQGSQARYPVLYMHDGQNLFDDQAIWGGWGVKVWADQMIKAQQVKPFIVVGIENTPGRMDEYTHTTDQISGNTVGGKAQDYADFLLKEVKPFIDGMYRTKPGRRHTAVMGSSLGGLISLWLGIQYPRTFFRVGALSSTFGWGQLGANNPTLGQIFQGKGFQNLVVYIDSGSPQDNYQVTIQMRDLMKQLNYLEGFNLQHYVEQGAVHNEKAWRDRLNRPLSFLLSWP